MRKLKFIILISLFFAALTNLHSLDMNTGASFCIHSQYSANTFRLAPGASLFFSIDITDDIEVRADLFTGSLIGHSLGGSVSGKYNLKIGNWQPSAGLFLSLDYGSYLFHIDELQQEPIMPFLPEIGAGVVLSPIRFIFEDKGFSILNLSIGTNLAYPGRVLIFAIELISFRISL